MPSLILVLVGGCLLQCHSIRCWLTIVLLLLLLHATTLPTTAATVGDDQ
jgi:hypothetical protein